MPSLLRRYLFWTYDRGSFHYDVMVTLILLFLFVSPHFINYRDRPVETVALHASEVLVKEAGRTADGTPRLLYQVRADDIPQDTTDTQLRAAILRLIEPISGEVTIDHYEPVRDAAGHIIAYNAWVVR